MGAPDKGSPRGRQRYRLPVRTLAPGEQLWLNLGDLIRQQQPDEEGNAIPPEVTAGSYSLRAVGDYGKGASGNPSFSLDSRLAIRYSLFWLVS